METSFLSIFHRPSFYRPFPPVPEDLRHQISGQYHSPPCYLHNHSLTSYSAKKCAVKDGDFLSQHFLPPIFLPALPPVPEDLRHQISGQYHSPPCYLHNHSLTSYSAKQCAVKDGDFCSQHFLPPIFLPALPPVPEELRHQILGQYHSPPCYLYNHSLTSYSAKKCAVKEGDFCSQHFSPPIFLPALPQFLKTSGIKYRANITHRHVTFTTIR